VAVHPVKNDSGAVTQLIFTARDVTRQKKLEDRLHYMARYDVLTGLPNRTYFAHLLKQQIARTNQEKRFVSVMILDLDRFKYVNDVFGFEAGDEVLKWTAEKLRATVEKEDIVARLGSDEFGVVHIDHVQPVDAASVVARILDAVLDPVPVEGRELALTMSAGISVHRQDGEDAETLIQNADIALAKAKSLGRNNVQFYSQDINARASEFVFMEKRLFSALKNDEYLVYYQPYHQLTTSKVAGAEALIKWRNTDLGLVSPSRFIPTLEDTGMIIDVGEWVLKTSCRQMKEWGKGKYPHPLSVNLSLIQLRHKYLLNMVSDSLSEFKLNPERLTLEVTEGIFMHDMEFSTSVLKRLKDIGVSISIDDFGTGYSSLSYLKRLPVDNVKIDISFVRDITKDPDAASMVTAITGMARSLNLKTIAEGIETEEQLNVLRLLRCDMGQGYYFSPALPPADFAQYLSGGPDGPPTGGPVQLKAAPTKTKAATATKTKTRGR
jgi:diguanylate cyclase (GGDEF)-like protein